MRHRPTRPTNLAHGLTRALPSRCAESDFYATDAGRQHFADQLTSIRYCIQETCNFDVLYAYLVSTPLGLTRALRLRSTPSFVSQTCGNYDFNYDRAKWDNPLKPDAGRPSRRSPRAL